MDVRFQTTVGGRLVGGRRMLVGMSIAVETVGPCSLARYPRVSFENALDRERFSTGGKGFGRKRQELYERGFLERVNTLKRKALW